MPPVPPQSVPAGSGQLGTPRVRPRHWAPSHRLGGSSELSPKSPIPLPLTTQARVRTAELADVRIDGVSVLPAGDSGWCSDGGGCLELACAPPAALLPPGLHEITLRFADAARPERIGGTARSNCPLGSAPARPLRLLRARLVAPCSSALPGWPPATETPATASAARASRLQSRPFCCLWPFRRRSSSD